MFYQFPRYSLKNSFIFSAGGCSSGRTRRNPTSAASVSHHLLLGICGSRLFHDGSDLKRLAHLVSSAVLKKPPPRSAFGYLVLLGAIKGSFVLSGMSVIRFSS